MRTLPCRAFTLTLWFVDGRRRPEGRRLLAAIRSVLPRRGRKRSSRARVSGEGENITRGALSQRRNRSGGRGRFQRPPLSCRAFATASNPAGQQDESVRL